jgi:hypothetical protein
MRVKLHDSGEEALTDLAKAIAAHEDLRADRGVESIRDAGPIESGEPAERAPVDGGNLDEPSAAGESAEDNGRCKVGRPRNPEPGVAIHMKWPKTLLEMVRDEAAKLSIGYQPFIRMAVSEYIRQRREGRD